LDSLNNGNDEQHLGFIYFPKTKQDYYYCLHCTLGQYPCIFSSGERTINQSNVFIKPFLHQQMSQSTIQKLCLKPQTASNVDVEAVARKN
jgi:hypothetical protein